MKTEITLTKMAKQGLFALVLFLTTGFASIAQPLYTQDSAGPNFCDGWAYLDSTNMSNSSSPVWINLSTNQIMNTAGPYSTFMLCPGDYSVSFTDNNGNDITLVFTIGGQGNSNPCTGFSVGISTTNADLNSCNGSITANVFNGTAPYTYSWSNPISPNINLNNISGLCPGQYFVSVIDANGCPASGSGIVNENNTGGGTNPIDTTIVNTLITQDATGINLCNGTAQLLDSVNFFPPVTWWSLNMGYGYTSDDFAGSGLCPGDWSVTFNDINGNSISLFFTIGVQGNPNPCQGFSATMTTTNTDINACTGTATITVSGGTAPYSYSWANSGASMINSQQNLCAGYYFADVIDANGCTTFVWDTVHVNNTGGGGSNPSDTIIIIINNTFPPNSVTDSLPTVTILDCNLDFDSIGSAYITNVQATNLGALVTWTIYDFFGNVIATYDISYNNVNPNGAVYEATLILMCGRSINTVQITDQFEYIPGSSSISEFSDLEINCVNPMTEVLKINFNREFEGQLILVDMKGATIFSTNVSAAHFEYNVSALNQGIYILQIHAQNGTSLIKLIK